MHKKRPVKQNGAIKTQVIKRPDNSKNAEMRRIMGRFAKRFSGERPDPLGFEFVFLPSLSELFGGCLTAPRSGALV